MFNQLALFPSQDRQISQFHKFANSYGLSLVVNHLSVPSDVVLTFIDSSRYEEVSKRFDLSNYKIIIVCPKEELPNTIKNFGTKALGFLGLTGELSSDWADLMEICLKSKENDLNKFGQCLVDIKSFTSTEKPEIVDLITKKLSSSNLNSRIVNQIASTADELIMNAFFDAPVDQQGNQLYNQVCRSEKITSPLVHIQMTIDPFSNIILKVKDTYGSMKKDKLLSHLGKKLKSMNYEPDLNYAGAGLGLVTSLKSGASLFFKVDPQNTTEVIVVFPSSKSYKAFRHQSQFLINCFK